MIQNIQQLSEEISQQAIQIDDLAKKKEEIEAKEQDAISGFDGEKVKLIPNPNFTDCPSVGTLLPINMANEIVSNLSVAAEEYNLAEFIKNELGYSSRIAVCKAFSSEQIDALVLAIRSHQKGNGFILGDMAGIGKGRVCAGIMRYAFMKKIIPVFITQKPYLFNDIYRDFKDIGGIGSDKKNAAIMPKPLILHSEGVIVGSAGTPVSTKQAWREKTSDGKIEYLYVDRTKEFSIDEICKRITREVMDTDVISLGEDFNCVMLPYSVISQAGPLRRNFIRAIAHGSYFVFDESHNAASSQKDSNILTRSLELIQESQGVLFSSATYAKNPNVYALYVVKTSLRNAVPTLDTIDEALEVGGENVSEYIASGLCKESQMIRRDRSFSTCNKITEYVGMQRQISPTGESVYIPQLNDNQREFFDTAIEYFVSMRNFVRSNIMAEATRVAVNRAIEGMRLRVANMDELDEINRISNVEIREERKLGWLLDNRGKYAPNYTVDKISGYKATFRSNVFLAIKAKFTADEIIKCLDTPVSYTDVDGTEHFAPMKPLIAIGNTGEQIFKDLKLSVGQRVTNDFSTYLKAIYNKVFTGEVKMRRVDDNYFRKKSELIAEGIEIEERKTSWSIIDSDFSDSGTERYRIQSELDEYNSGYPFSIIDYLRDTIESKRRSDIYYRDPLTREGAKYGSLTSPYYTFQEGTSRDYMLVRDGEEWIYQKNNRIRSTSAIFKGFNEGKYDVFLLNVVASTGGSAQSSLKEGVDVRPRNMYIIQFELDVNVEVQKRGRVNRTGQKNFPTYTYIITQIPVEARMYLMLRKKLRKLDANTSADQSASAENASIKNFRGEEINDIYNKYGYDCFVNEFITNPDNAPYAAIFQSLGGEQEVSDSDDTGAAELADIKVEQFNVFVRELELYPSNFQETFFVRMNQLYGEYKARLIAKGLYQEELVIKNYKAQLKQRVVRQVNSGESIFSLPLFLTDYYTLDTFVPLSLDQLERKSRELAVWQGQRVDPQIMWQNMITEADAASRTYRASLERIYAVNAPQRDFYATEELYNDAYERWDRARMNRVNKDMENLESLLSFMDFMPPQKAILDETVAYGLVPGRFLGYKFRNADAEVKYAPQNMSFVFAFLALHTTMTLDFSRAATILRITQDAEQNDLLRDRLVLAETWQRLSDNRVIRRFYTGNILSGIVQANIDRNLPDYAATSDNVRITDFFISRFTNFDGSITTGIELVTDVRINPNRSIPVSNTPLEVACNTEQFRSYIMQLPITFGDRLAENMFPVFNIENDDLIDRAIVIVKNRIDNRDYIAIAIIQSAKIKKSQGVTIYEERARGREMWNWLYHDEQFLEEFSSYITPPAELYREVKWAQKVNFTLTEEAKIQKEKDKQKGDKTLKTKELTSYSNMAVKLKTLKFDTTNSRDMSTLERFFDKLNKKYKATFSFRASVESYYNIEPQEYEETSNTAVRDEYPEGQYDYEFIRTIPDSVFEQIPNVIERIPAGIYGGVRLSRPIPPNRLPSFELKPLNIPNEMLIKLAFSALDGVQKADFIRKLQDIAPSSSDIQVGEYVRKTLSRNSVPIIYFFGDARGSEYGRLMKEYTLTGDVANLVLIDRTGEEQIVLTPVTQITESNSESFLLKLLELI
jgi:hypothetical protein